VGGGYIGLEAAAVAAQRRLAVTVIEAAPRILARVAAPETADAIRALHQANGVTIREGVGLARLLGAEGRLTGAEMADGSRIEADFAILGIGIEPNQELAEATGLEVAAGIRVDARARTSDPAIWAAGDCTRLPLGGAEIRLESVQNAIDQAEAAAADMMGAGTDYAPVPWFWSDQYDLKLQIAGLGTGADRVVVRAAPGAPAWSSRSHWYFAGDRLIAVDALGDPRAYMVGKRLLETGRGLDPTIAADPASDLRAALG
jgi:3-phenylpropionate/trans-cinnamate dioxygenase ferredoxin reductase component